MAGNTLESAPLCREDKGQVLQEHGPLDRRDMRSDTGISPKGFSHVRASVSVRRPHSRRDAQETSITMRIAPTEPFDTTRWVRLQKKKIAGIRAKGVECLDHSAARQANPRTSKENAPICVYRFFFAARRLSSGEFALGGGPFPLDLRRAKSAIRCLSSRSSRPNSGNMR